MGNGAENRPLNSSDPAWDGMQVGPICEGRPLPLLVESTEREFPLTQWIRSHRDGVEKTLQMYGGLLFRGFRIDGWDGFRAFAAANAGTLMGYNFRASPRSELADGIYTSTDYPPAQTIFLHNESSFADVWPLRIFFYCAKPAKSGGETPIADVRRVHDRLDPEIVESFGRRGVMYVQNLGGAFGLSWQDVFQTDDREEMEAYCRRSGIAVEWKDDKQVRTRQVRPAIVRHPRTAEPIWFNHAAVLHVSTVPAPLRHSLLKMLKEQDLPNNTYYGDGASIEPPVLDAIRAAYREEEVVFAWQPGDVLMLDNMLVAHGRRPFCGPRQVAVAMAEPTSWNDVEHRLG